MTNEQIVSDLTDAAKVLDVHAKSRRLPPGDNDFSVSAKFMREAASTIERLERERDALRIKLNATEEHARIVTHERDWATDVDLAAAEARITELEATLAPFIEAGAELFNDWCPDDTPAWYYSKDGFDEPSPLTVGDFRRAARPAPQPPV